MAAPQDLLDLARFLADPRQDMCILAEGNVSACGDGHSFWVKGSGQEMARMDVEGFSHVSLAGCVKLLDEQFADDLAIRSALNQVCHGGPPPSTEAFMHALLLGEEGTHYVAHAHPTPLLSLLCLPGADAWATHRLFPDEIVCCGPATCFVPYVAPGLELARSIRTESEGFKSRYGIAPKLFWLQNHGMIVTGATAREVTAGCAMAVKAARVLLGALQTGSEPKWLTEAEVAHIYQWPDEHARQKALFGG